MVINQLRSATTNHSERLCRRRSRANKAQSSPPTFAIHIPSLQRSGIIYGFVYGWLQSDANVVRSLVSTTVGGRISPQTGDLNIWFIAMRTAITMTLAKLSI